MHTTQTEDTRYDDGEYMPVKRLRMATTAGALVAYMEWRVDTGEVIMIWVKAEMRRQGHAARMWEIARAQGAEHSARRTVAGDAWARAMMNRYGDMLPRLRPL